MTARTITPSALAEWRQRLTRPPTKKERRQNARLVDALEKDLREAARYASGWDATTVGLGARVEKAIIIIRGERWQKPGLTFTEAVRAVKAAGLSRRTAARAWKVCKVPD